MPTPTIRDFHPADLDQIVAVWEQTSDTGDRPVYGLAEILEACAAGLALVVVAERNVVGVVVARVEAERAQVLMFGLDKAWRGQGLGSLMLAELEKRLIARGVFQVSALLPAGETGSTAFHNNGYEPRALVHHHRSIPLQPQEVHHLDALGGRMLPRNLWEQLSGMSQEKDIIERRLVLPLAHPELADSYGVQPPRAVVLFGPPGTGKTTFAKAVASRLSWPFVEISPSRLTAEPAGLAAALRAAFQQIGALEHVVVFIDEVEEIAAHRSGEPPSATQAVTNELLKIIPTFRDRPGRLLVCATNFIRALDRAFLRHGRFDYIIPIGLPDASARQAIWRRYIPSSIQGDVDVEALVAASDRFTPADIEYAARRASQQAFEAAMNTDPQSPGDRGGPTTADYLQALTETRATVPPEIFEEFLEDTTAIARF